MAIEETHLEEQQPAKKKGRWKRILKWTALGLLLLVLVARLALPWVLPKVISRVAAQQGLEVHYGDLDLSLLTGGLQLWHVSIAKLAEDGAAVESQLGDMEFLVVDLEVTSLLKGNLVARRVEVDGFDLYARRDSAGEGWQWQGLGGPQAAEEETAEEETAEEPETDEPSEPQPFDWDLGFQVDALRVQHLQLHVSDGVQDPPLETTLEINLRLSDLGHGERPTRLELYAHAEGILDVLSVKGTLSTGGARLDAQLGLAVRGLRPGPVDSYLRALGVGARTRQVDLGLDLTLKTEPVTEDGSEISVALELDGTHWLADGVEQASIDRVEIALKSLTHKSLLAETVLVEGVRARAVRDENGLLVVGGFALLKSEDAAEAQVEASEDSVDVGPGFAVEIPELRLAGVELEFLDRGVTPAAELKLEIPELTLGPVVKGAGVEAPPMVLAGRVLAPGLWEEMSLDGELQPFAEELSVRLGLEVEGLTLEAAEPYLLPLGLRPDWQAASLSGELTVRAVTEASGASVLHANLKGMRFADGGTLFAQGDLALEGLATDPQLGQASISNLSLEGTDFLLRKDAAGVWNMLGISLVPGQGGAPGESDLASPGEADQPEVSQVFGGKIQVESLVLGGKPGGPARGPATFSMTLGSEGLAQRLELSGTVASAPGPLDLSVKARLDGEGLGLDPLEAWLLPLGIESRWEDARLGMGLEAEVQQGAEDLRLALSLEDLNFENRGETWLQLARVEVPEVLVREGRIKVAPVSMEGPRALVERDGEGALVAMGLRFVAPEREAGPALSEEQEVPGELASETPEVGEPMILELPELDWQGVGLTWRDRMQSPVLETELGMSVRVRDVVWGAGGEREGKDRCGMDRAGFGGAFGLCIGNGVGSKGHGRELAAFRGRFAGGRLGSVSAPGVDGGVGIGTVGLAWGNVPGAGGGGRPSFGADR